MEIKVIRCDLCREEYRMDVGRNFQEVGRIKLDMRGCYYVQTVWEKEICSVCAKKIADVIGKIMLELDKGRQSVLNTKESTEKES